MAKERAKTIRGRASLQTPLPYLRLRQLLHTTNKNTITITKNFICLNRVVKIVSSVFTSLLVILPLSLYMYIVRAIVSVCVLQRSLIFSFTTNTLFFTYFVFNVVLREIKKTPLLLRGVATQRIKVAVLKLNLNNVDNPLFYIF